MHGNVQKQTEKVLLCTLHNGENDSHKRQFLALGVRSQSWKLNNLSKKILVKLTGVTSCLLQFDRKIFCTNNFSFVNYKVSNLRNKITDKRGQSALISWCQFDSGNIIYSRVRNRRACTFISGKVCLLSSINVKRQTWPEIKVHARLFGTLE